MASLFQGYTCRRLAQACVCFHAVFHAASRLFLFAAGTAAREPSRPRGGSRPSLSQRLGVLAGYLRSLAIGIVAAVLRTITWQLNRWVVLLVFITRRKLHIVRIVSTRWQASTP